MSHEQRIKDGLKMLGTRSLGLKTSFRPKDVCAEYKQERASRRILIKNNVTNPKPKGGL